MDLQLTEREVSSLIPLIEQAMHDAHSVGEASKMARLLKKVRDSSPAPQQNYSVTLCASTQAHIISLLTRLFPGQECLLFPLEESLDGSPLFLVEGLSPKQVTRLTKVGNRCYDLCILSINHA